VFKPSIVVVFIRSCILFSLELATAKHQEQHLSNHSGFQALLHPQRQDIRLTNKSNLKVTK